MSEGKGLQIHPMDQFVIKPLFGESEHIGIFTFTNMAFWLVLAVIVVAIVFVYGTRGRALVPTRFQSVGETIYGLVQNMLRENAGKDAMGFFPIVLTLFVFILVSNLLGLIPTSFAPTSHIAITGLMAVFVFLFVTLLGFYKHGFGFLRLFWVSSAPLVLRPVLALIELISYFVRPVSHSIRLGGNIMAGHAVIKVLAGFAGVLGIGALLPIATITGIYMLEFLVAIVQAYVFTILTCIYLHDAMHPGH